MQTKKPFLTPADVARALDVSSSTVLRLIHSGQLPAIAVSERIYRIPRATFEMYLAGTLRAPADAPVGGQKTRPKIGEGESLPKARRRRDEHLAAIVAEDADVLRRLGSM